MLSQIRYHWLYYEKMPNKSLQATRDGALSLSRSRWLADVTSPACLSSGR